MRFRREWLLVLSAAIIIALIAWKQMQPRQDLTQFYSLKQGEFPAPGFQLHDSRSHMVRLSAYQGRHKILVVFYVASAGPDQHPLLIKLREQYADFERQNIKILAISAATPWFNREAFKRSGKFPFPLLSDPTLQAHRLWYAYDSERNQPLQSVFVIDRRGIVKWFRNGANFPSDTQEILKQFATAN